MFSGSLPASFCAQINLRWVNIHDNFFEGSISTCFLNSALQFYRLDSNFFTGPVPYPFFNQGDSIIVLMLHDNLLSGHLPDMFGGFLHLAFLNLGNNELSGPLPPSLATMPLIAKIYLHNNKFSGSLPAISFPSSCFTSQTCPWIFLQHLYLSHNRLTGSIPDSFHLLPSLSCLMLQGNLLSGAFPSFGGYTMNGLTYLILSDNLFAGPLRGDTLARLPSLDWLDVANNALTGPLPDTLPPGLFVLEFADNLFTGNIPAAWTELEAVRTISLARNRLFQDDRVEVALETTQYLDLSGNPFEFLPLAEGFLTLSPNSMLVQLRIWLSGNARAFCQKIIMSLLFQQYVRELRARMFLLCIIIDM